jgi:hydroxyacylglutathione hydrolase
MFSNPRREELDRSYSERRKMVSQSLLGRRRLRRGTLKIEALVVPPLGNNVYVLSEDGSDEAVVVDVAQGSAAILQILRELDLHASTIINTHGHTDHTAEDDLVRKATAAKLAIHELDAYRLAIDDEASQGLGIKNTPIEPDIQLVEGQLVKFGPNTSIKVLHTPGHTEGSICLYHEKSGQLFSGDTLFAHGYGRVDGKGASPESMRESLRRLLQLPPTTEVYPGHGSFTTIGEEKQWLLKMRELEESSA